MKRKYFPFCFYVLVSVLCLGKPSLAYPAGSFGGELLIPPGATTSETDSITPLKIGDKIPDELWDYAFPVVIPHSDNVQYLSLGDFRDKLIILDFWATWCAPCISSLHKLDTLQQEFADDLLVFPTSYEPQDKVRKFFIDKGWSLPTAYEETHLKKFFPHRSIPHQVWIKGGEVMAIAGPESANRENVNDALKGNGNKILIKENRVVDRDKPLLIDGNGGGEDALRYYSVITKRLKTRTAGSTPFSDTGIQIFNSTLDNLLFTAYQDTIKSKKRIVWEVSDSLKSELLIHGRKLTGHYVNDRSVLEWADQNIFGYEFRSDVPVGTEMVKKIMRDDLKNYFLASKKIEFIIELRPLKAIVLRRTDPSLSIKSRGGDRRIERAGESYVMVNQPVRRLVRFLSNVDEEAVFVDETGYDRIDIILDSNSNKNMLDANRELSGHGLMLSEESREMTVLVIKPYNNDENK